MELKDFVKGVIFDITNAINESQSEVSNGAIINPANSTKPVNAINIDKDKKAELSYIDFEIAITVGDESEKNSEAGIGIKVVSAFIGGKTGIENRQINENISKIKFSIPIVYPIGVGGIKKNIDTSLL